MGVRGTGGGSGVRWLALPARWMGPELLLEVVAAVGVAIARAAMPRWPGLRLRRIGLARSDACVCRTRCGGGGNRSQRVSLRTVYRESAMPVEVLVGSEGGVWSRFSGSCLRLRSRQVTAANASVERFVVWTKGMRAAIGRAFVLDWQWSIEEARVQRTKHRKGLMAGAMMRIGIGLLAAGLLVAGVARPRCARRSRR